MNYFERLVRRALLQPATRAGAPPADPFEQTDDWPLDARSPGRAPQPPTPAVTQAVPALVAPPVPSRPLTAAAAPGDRDAAGPLEITETAFAEPALPPAAPPPDDTPHLEHRPALPTAPMLPAEPSPLAIADRFLNSLGVRLPDVAAFDVSHPQPRSPQDALEELPNDVARVPLRHPAIVPAPPVPPVVASEAAIASGSASPLSRERDVTAPHAATAGDRPGPPHREVLVVERRAVAVESRGRPRIGAGAPHIGLGQL